MLKLNTSYFCRGLWNQKFQMWFLGHVEIFV